MEAKIKATDRRHYQNIDTNGVDVCDGVERTSKVTNPFKNRASTSANPFECFVDTVDGAVKNRDAAPAQHDFEEGSLVKGL